VKLHYRKLMVASIAFPLVVVVLIFLATPSLMQSRSSAMFASMRSQIRQMETLLVQIEVINSQSELEEPIRLAYDVAENQSESLIDLRESIAGENSGATSGAGLVTVLSTFIGMLGTLTSIIFSWRQDMRDAHTRLLHVEGTTEHAAGQRKAA